LVRPTAHVVILQRGMGLVIASQPDQPGISRLSVGRDERTEG
jgi:hypothetical protein